MALSRSTVLLLLLLLPCPAVAYLAASLGDVSASSQCLSSAAAVLQEYPGSWAAWSTHAPELRGAKCWFPVMSENHSRHIEALLRHSAEARAKATRTKEAATKEVQANKNPAEYRQIEPSVNKSEMKELGWNFRSRTAKVGSVRIFDEFAEVASSFNDRFAAVLEVNSVSQPSTIQRMMDPVGAIP